MVRSNVSCLRCITSVVLFVFGCECVYRVKSGVSRGFPPPQEVFTQSHGVFAYRFRTNSNCNHSLVFLTVEWQRCMWKLFMQDTGLFSPPEWEFSGSKAVWTQVRHRMIIPSCSSHPFPGWFQTVVWFECQTSSLICFLQLRVIVTEPRRFHSWGACVCVVCWRERWRVSILPPRTTYFTSLLLSCSGWRQCWKRWQAIGSVRVQSSLICQLCLLRCCFPPKPSEII